MAKAVYSYSLNKEEKKLSIIDEFDAENPTVTVTNDAENVLTEIRAKECKCVEKMEVYYRDSYGSWNQIIPIWENSICTRIKFVDKRMY